MYRTQEAAGFIIVASLHGFGLSQVSFLKFSKLSFEFRFNLPMYDVMNFITGRT